MGWAAACHLREMGDVESGYVLERRGQGSRPACSR